MKVNKALIEKIPSAKWVSIAPGRVNLLGEHVDYNDGLVLPTAIDRFVQVAFSARADHVVNVYSIDLKDSVSFSMDSLASKKDRTGNELKSWAQYAAGVAWAMMQEGFSPAGMDAVVTSDVPIGAGLSSSAAFTLALAAAWQKIGDFKIDRMRLAQMCRRAENDYVGVNCGLMDQFACAHGVARHALYFDTRNLAWQPIPLPLDTTIVIADSKVDRTLASSAYNQRRQECQTALSIAQGVLPNITSLRDINLSDLGMLADLMPEVIFQRTCHVVEEIERVKKGCQCLFSDDAKGFGELMTASHASLRDLYAVSIPALDALVEIARGLPGVYGARLTGAGFGGCTVNLVESARADAIIREIRTIFKQKTGMDAMTYICKPSRGVHVEAIQ